VRFANESLGVLEEHPNPDIRRIYAGEIAAQVGLPVEDFVSRIGNQRKRLSVEPTRSRQRVPMENAEFAALVLLVQEWDSIAEWLIEALFDSDANRLAFLALADAGNLAGALDAAPPDARDVLERAAVADLDLDAVVEAKSLIAAATKRELRQRTRMIDAVSLEEDRAAKLDLMALDEPDSVRALASAESLLGWLHRRTEERSAAVE